MNKLLRMRKLRKAVISVLLVIANFIAVASAGAETVGIYGDIGNDIADVVFDRQENGDISVEVNYPEELSGKVLFTLSDSDGRFSDVDAQDIAVDDGNKYIFTDCADNQTIKVLFWNNINDMQPLSESLTVKTEDIKQIPDILRVTSEGNLAKKDGTAVQLKGVNFGGWLIQETWMCPLFAFNSDITVKNGTENGWANLDTLEAMESSLGAAETEKLIKAYQDNYITEWDFSNVKNLGFNCVRIPFWYRNFMSDENGTYITASDDDNPGFEKLDWACDMAEKYGLYLIFDMHGCPGGQNGDHSSGRVGRNHLYKETKYQDIMEDLWVRIAERYKDRTCVAAYDIMNEPLNNADTAHNVLSKYVADPWSDTTLRVGVYDRMVKAIRKVDPYHVITLEGIWRMDRLPDPSTYGWENMMYQLHSYDSDDATTTQLVNSLTNAKKNYGVAAYMGEFNPSLYNNKIVTLMNNDSISYTLWNYKTAMPVGDSEWGLYHRNYSGDLYNICGSTIYGKISSSWNNIFYSLKNLTAAEIKQLYTKWWTETYLSTKTFTLNTTLKGYLK